MTSVAAAFMIAYTCRRRIRRVDTISVFVGTLYSSPRRGFHAGLRGAAASGPTVIDGRRLAAWKRKPFAAMKNIEKPTIGFSVSPAGFRRAEYTRIHVTRYV